MPDITPSVPADVVQAAELIHRDIAEAMDVIYGEIGGMDDTPEDVDATSKRIADDIRIVLNWVLAQAQPAPISPVGADTPDDVEDALRDVLAEHGITNRVLTEDEAVDLLMDLMDHVRSAASSGIAAVSASGEGVDTNE